MHSNICIQSVVKNLFTTSQYKICIKISYLNNFEWIYFKINYWILLNTTEYYWILLHITAYYWILNITEFFKSLNIQMRGLLNIQLLQVSLTVLTVSEFIFPGNIHWQWIYLPSSLGLKTGKTQPKAGAPPLCKHINMFFCYLNNAAVEANGRL